MSLQRAKLDQETDQDYLDALGHRVRSIALIHEQLYNLKEFDIVDVRVYVVDLLRNFKLMTPGRQIHVEQDIDEVYFNLETITPIGLICSELINNSLKYNQDGEELKIYIGLKSLHEGYTMHYHDNGIGYSEGKFTNSQSGIGFTIVDSLARQLSARVETYNDNGAHFKITFHQKTISPL